MESKLARTGSKRQAYRESVAENCLHPKDSPSEKLQKRTWQRESRFVEIDSTLLVDPNFLYVRFSRCRSNRQQHLSKNSGASYYNICGFSKVILTNVIQSLIVTSTRSRNDHLRS
jgi:hypothetical protein